MESISWLNTTLWLMAMLLLLVPRAASFVYFYCQKNFVKGNGKVHIIMEHFNKVIKS